MSFLSRRWSSLFGVLALLLSVSPVNAEETKLSIPKVNAVLSSLLEQVLQAKNGELGKFFTEATFVIDEKGTDVASPDRLKIKLSSRATASAAAWSPDEDTTLQLDVSGYADRLKKTAGLALRAALETDTLALFNFAAAKIVPEWCEPSKGKMSTDLEKAVCEQVGVIATAQDLTKVFASLGRLSHLAVVDADARVVKAEDTLAKAKPEDKSWAQRSLESAKKDAVMAKFFEAKMLAAFKAGKGSETFKLELKNLDLFNDTSIHQFDLFLDNGRFELGIQLVQRNIKDMDGYFEQRQRIEQELIKLQNQEPKTTKSATEAIEFFLSITKSVIGKPQP